MSFVFHWCNMRMGKEQLANDPQTCIDVHNYLYTHVILSESQHWDGRADAHNLK